jgi:hypothetical protein
VNTDLRYRPLDDWQGPTTPEPRPWSDYASGLDRIVAELDRSFGHLKATEATILVDVPPRAIRVDGQLRADAAPGPRVALLIITEHGPLRFQCDRWSHWQDNLRCIALTLDRLRLIDRDGCAVGGQAYRGWAAIPQTTGVGMTRTEAARLLCEATAETIGEDPSDIDGVARVARSLYTDAARRLHPDVGGDPATFARLTQARDVLLAPLEIGAGRA